VASRQASGQGAARRGCRGTHPGVVPCQGDGGAQPVSDDGQTPGNRSEDGLSFAAEPEHGSSDLPPIGRAGRVTHSDSSSQTVKDSAARAAPRRRRGGWRVVTFLLSVVVLLVAAGVVVSFLLSPPSATPRVVEFEVLPGWGGNRVATELADA